MTLAIVDDLSPIVIPEDLGISRLPPRPVEHRQPNYIEEFDFYTVFYDVFDVPHLGNVAMIGPPFLNLEPLVRKLRFKTSRWSRLAPQFKVLIRNGPIWLPRSQAIDKLTIKGVLRADLNVGKSYCDLFVGKRVILAISRNNDLTWITDWISFHAHNHGCDAALIYDNRSDAYSRQEMLDHIARHNVVSTCIVVDWPFKYGPHGGPARIWDSNFGQMGMLEHARWRFLANARSVLHIDVDEFLVCPGTESIFEMVERSPGGFIDFPGRWISNAVDEHSGVDFSSRRQRDFTYLDMDAPPCPRKWACVPSKILPTEQWCTHEILYRNSETCQGKPFFFRHFRAISTSWKYHRSYLEKPVMSRAN